MDVRYRRERNESYLIIEEEGEGDSYAVRMLTENRIPGVLALSVKKIDHRTIYSYEISGRQSLRKLLEKRQITAGEIRRLYYGIERSLNALENYLLDIEQVLLEPEFIYILPDYSQVFLCCHPGTGGDFFHGMQRLSQFLLNKIDHMNQSSVELAYELFRITSEEDFRFQDIRQALEQSGAETPVYPLAKEQAERREAGISKAAVCPEVLSVEMVRKENELLPEHLREPEKKMFWSLLVPVGGFLLVGIFYVLGGLNRFSPLSQGGILLLAAALLILAGLHCRRNELEGGRRKGEEKDGNYPWREENVGAEASRQNIGARTGAAGANRSTREGYSLQETALLAPEKQTLPCPRHLISQNLLRSETLTVDYLPLRVGKLTESCELVINQPVVSRIHARLELREGAIYLTDLHSTNGTFQNGVRLLPERPYLLQSGDEVAFADVKYIFQ